MYKLLSTGTRKFYREYRIDLNFGGAKLWRIDSISPNLTLQFFKYARTCKKEFLEMSILKYFHLSVDETDKKLPDPHGSLCKEVPSSSIERANTSVAPIIERQESG